MTEQKKTPRLFGTDGIRAPFGHYPLDEGTVRRVGFEVARRVRRPHKPTRAFIAGDTRDSTETLTGWLATGIEAAGGFVSAGGTLPTPGVAYVVREGRYDFGVAISASHNPWPDNGLKLFDGEGFKWSVTAEKALEADLKLAEDDDALRGFEDSISMNSEAATLYAHALSRTLATDRALDGLRIVVDCANGATTPFAADLFSAAGAEVIMIGDQPNGKNINLECGSTHPEAMAQRTREEKAHLGVAFDGDGDRVLFADETGRMWDGDALLFLWATLLQKQGELKGDRIVATTMSNIGLERALAGRGIGVDRCDVGDRVVVETMREAGLRLGGEQSGHIIDLSHSSTGDGLLTALQLGQRVISSLRDSGRPLSTLLDGFERYPQVLKNVRVSSKPPFAELPDVARHAEEISHRLAENGRLVLRYSGTEPLARVMIEGQDQGEIDALAFDLCETIESAIGLSSAG